MKYTLFLIENHYIIKLYNLLFLLSNIAGNPKKDLSIDEKRLKYLYFFLENRNVLKKIQNNEEIDFNTIEKFLEFNEMGLITRLGLAKKLVDVEIKKNISYYKITSEGQKRIEQIDNVEYMTKEEITQMKEIRKMSNKKLENIFL